MPALQRDVAGPRLVELQDGALVRLTSRNQLVATAGGLLSETFTYDGLNRLQTSTIGAAVKSTYYDEIGNITSKTGAGVYTYPTRPNAVGSITGTVAGLSNPIFEYDNNGNLVKGLARAYAWTSYDMASSIDRLSGDTAVQRTAFIYGPEHERTRQTVSPVPGLPTRTIWYAGSTEKEIDSAANVTIIRIDMPMGLGFLEERLNGTAIAVAASAVRTPRYFLKDHLGSTLVEMDQAQAVLQRMSYDAWGRRRNANGTDDTGPLWGSLKNNQDHSGYTGHEHLDQLGLVHMNARMYDPLLGRHTSADPTVPDPANAQSFNRYSYVLNNALAFVDPTGLAPNSNVKNPPSSTNNGEKRGEQEEKEQNRLMAGKRGDRYSGFSAGGLGVTHGTVAQAANGATAVSGAGALKQVGKGLLGAAVNAVEGAGVGTVLLIGVATAPITGVVWASMDNPNNGSEQADADALSIAPGTGLDGADGDKAPVAADRGSRRPSREVKDAADQAATDENGNLRCQYCGQGLTTDPGQGNSREYDHYNPWSRGGGSGKNNVVDACRDCNRGPGGKGSKLFPDEWVPPPRP